MAEMTPKAAKVMTIAGVVDSLIAIVIGIFIFFGRTSVPVVIPALLLISGIMIIVVSLSYHTHK